MLPPGMGHPPVIPLSNGGEVADNASSPALHHGSAHSFKATEPVPTTHPVPNPVALSSETKNANPSDLQNRQIVQEGRKDSKINALAIEELHVKAPENLECLPLNRQDKKAWWRMVATLPEEKRRKILKREEAN